MLGQAVTDLTLRQLFAVNVLLQIADGALTHAGIGLGFLEGNPLLDSSMSIIGVGTALLLYKSYSCGLLLLVRRNGSAYVSAMLTGTALAVTLLALVPWLGKYASLVAFLLLGT
ncbi:MAG: DUF5658 family protein [Candidatus Binatia bacterium]